MSTNPLSRVAYSMHILAAVLLLASSAYADEFRSAWPTGVERPWIGPEYWANRLQDWRLTDGRLECLEQRPSKPMRTVHLLTRRLGKQPGDFSISVRLGMISDTTSAAPDAAAGFLIGAGPQLDYRAAALVHHSPGPDGGLIAAVDATGRTVFRDMTTPHMPLLAAASTSPSALPPEVVLRFTAHAAGDIYQLTLTVHDEKTDAILSETTLKDVAPHQLVGNLALLSHPGSPPDDAESNESPVHTARF